MICPDCGGKKYRRNAESSIRKSEREYAGGDFRAGVRLLQLRVRSGLIPIDYVRRAAALGDARAQALALGLEPWPITGRKYFGRVRMTECCQQWDSGAGWVNKVCGYHWWISILEGLPRILIVSWAADVAEHVLPMSRGRSAAWCHRAIEDARRWVDDPSDSNTPAGPSLRLSRAAVTLIHEGNRAASGAASAASHLPNVILEPRASGRDDAAAARALNTAADASNAAAAARSPEARRAHPHRGPGLGRVSRNEEEVWQRRRLIQYLLGEVQV